MDFRQIQYFVTLYEEGNMTRAARKLNIVQPALSAQIRRIEQQLGRPVFERTSRGVTPTATGRAMYDLYLPILLDLQNANQRMMELSGKVLGKLAVGVIPSIANSVLADVLRRFRTEYPDVEVKVDEAYSGTLADWVLTRDLDLAVVNRPRHRRGLTVRPLVKEELLVVQRKSRGKNATEAIEFEDLVKLKLVLPSRQHGLRLIMEQAAERKNLSVRPQVEVDAMAPTLNLVASTNLATILPAIATRKSIVGMPLQARRIAGRPLVRELVYAYQTRRPLSLAARKFVEVLTDELTRGAGRRWLVTSEGEPGQALQPSR